MIRPPECDAIILSRCTLCDQEQLVLPVASYSPTTVVRTYRYLCEQCLVRELWYRWMSRIQQQALLALFQQARAEAAQQAALERWLRRQFGETRYAALDAEVIAL